MQELVNLISNILFLPIIPVPLSFNNVQYINLFSIGLAFFVIFLLSLILKKLLAGSGG